MVMLHTCNEGGEPSSAPRSLLRRCQLAWGSGAVSAPDVAGTGAPPPPTTCHSVWRPSPRCANGQLLRRVRGTPGELWSISGARAWWGTGCTASCRREVISARCREFRLDEASRRPGAASRPLGAASRAPDAASRRPGETSRGRGSTSRGRGETARRPGERSRRPGAASRRLGAASRAAGDVSGALLHWCARVDRSARSLDRRQMITR
jgi:hypothetical protein